MCACVSLEIIWLQHILSQLLLSWFLGKYISPIIINNKSKFIHITTSILLFLPWVVATYRFSFGLMYYFVSCLQYKPKNCQPVNPVIYPKHCLWKDKPFHFLDDFIIIKLWQMMPNEKITCWFHWTDPVCFSTYIVRQCSLAVVTMTNAHRHAESL